MSVSRLVNLQITENEASSMLCYLMDSYFVHYKAERFATAAEVAAFIMRLMDASGIGDSAHWRTMEQHCWKMAA